MLPERFSLARLSCRPVHPGPRECREKPNAVRPKTDRILLAISFMQALGFPGADWLGPAKQIDDFVLRSISIAGLRRAVGLLGAVRAAGVEKLC